MVPTNPQNSIKVCRRGRSRETRSLDRKHRPHTAVADCRQQPLEAWTGYAAARSSKIVVDDLDCRPAELFGAIGKPVLPPLAFKIVHQLIRGRLADIDASAALEMLSRDLGHGRSPHFLPRPASLRSRGAGLPRGSRVRPCEPGTALQAASPRRTGLAGGFLIGAA